MSTAPIFDIQHLCVHDGPGVRTTVFFQGCNLRCRWCHNPEGLEARAQILFDARKCIGCGDCVPACPQGAHALGEWHDFDRSKCLGCGRCAAVCPAGALTLCGKRYTPGELLPLVLADKAFYGADGGVTCSGGETLRYADFLTEFLPLCRAEGLTVAIDTAGAVPWSAFEKTLPFADWFLYDIKLADPEKHRAWTGCDNRLILENLHKLDAEYTDIHIRIPLIGGVNDDESEMRAIGEIAAGLRRVSSVTLVPYHSFGAHKYTLLGADYGMTDTAKVAEEKRQALHALLASMGLPMKER